MLNKIEKEESDEKVVYEQKVLWGGFFLDFMSVYTDDAGDYYECGRENPIEGY